MGFETPIMLNLYDAVDEFAGSPVPNDGARGAMVGATVSLHPTRLLAASEANGEAGSESHECPPMTPAEHRYVKTLNASGYASAMNLRPRARSTNDARHTNWRGVTETLWRRPRIRSFCLDTMVHTGAVRKQSAERTAPI